MTVETATHIDDLDETLPAGGDVKSEGDNHLRLLKDVLKTSFTGSSWPRALQSWADKSSATVAKSANATVVAADDGKLFLGDATTASFQLDIPAASAVDEMVVAFKKVDSGSNTVTVAPSSGTIDGASSIILSAQYDFVIVWSNGTSWHIVGRNPSAIADVMTKTVFDPTNVGGDVFDMDNMNEGADTKIMTAAERASIAAAVQPGDNISTLTNDSGFTDDQTGAEIVSAIDTQLGGSSWQSGGSGSTNIVVVEDATSVEIQSSSGANDTIVGATASDAGVMVASDKSKLDGIAAGAVAEGAAGDTFATAHLAAADPHTQYFLRSAWFPSLKGPAFGATGDGATDDSSAVNAAMAAAITAGGLICEPGVYLVPSLSMDTFKLPAGFQFVCPGGMGSVFLDNQATRDTVALSDSEVAFWLEGSNIRVSGLGLRNFAMPFAASDSSYTGFTYNSFTTSGDLSNIEFDHVRFENCVFPLWVRTQNDTSSTTYWAVSDWKLHDNEIVDCAYGFNFKVLDLHRIQCYHNFFQLTHARTLASGEQSLQINAIALDSNNADDDKADLAQLAEASGGHTISNNIFAGINWTGTGPATGAEMQHVRVTQQNGVTIEGNFFGPLYAPNHTSGVTDFDVEMVYTKVIGLNVIGNTFEGAVAGATAIDNAMLRLKGIGVLAAGHTRDYATVVTGNHFKGGWAWTSGGGFAPVDNDKLIAAIDSYSSNHLIIGNTFEDIYLGATLQAAIMSHNPVDGSVIGPNSFHRLRTVAGAKIAAVQIREGGVNCRIDGVLCVEPCDDDVGSEFRGVAFIDYVDGTAWENWRVDNIELVNPPSTVTSRGFHIDGNDNASSTYKGITVQGISKSGANAVDYGISTARLPVGNVERFRLGPSDFTDITTPISNVAAISFSLGLDNLDATTDPGVGDDLADGYAVGSRWVNNTTGKEFVCVDASDGTAVWKATAYTVGTGAGDVSQGNHGHTSGSVTGTPYSAPWVDASGVLDEISLGASGTVLTSNGPSSVPTMQTPGEAGAVSGTFTTMNSWVNEGWLFPYGFVAAASTFTLTAEREYWMLTQWQSLDDLVGLGTRVTTAQASSTIAMAAYACGQDFSIGTRYARVTASAASIGDIEQTFTGVSVPYKSLMWINMYSDTANVAVRRQDHTLMLGPPRTQFRGILSYVRNGITLGNAFPTSGVGTLSVETITSGCPAPFIKV